jgi:hypothetical protein
VTLATAAVAVVSCSEHGTNQLTELDFLGPQLAETSPSAQQCEVISFDGFNHRDVIGPFTLFGGDVTVIPSAVRASGVDAGPRAYDTELWDLDGATLRPPPPGTSCVPQNFHYDQQKYINCPECMGKIAVATNACYAGTDDTFDSDNLGGASITFSFTGGPFTIPSFEAVDCDDASKNILLKVGNSGDVLTLIGSCDLADGGEGYGDGIVSDVTTTPVEFNDIARFEFLGSGGVDNIEVCRPSDGGEGCTPGYWKNHLEDWPATGYSPMDDFDATFGVDLFSPDITLGQAIRLGGGGVKKLARHGTAALLSAAHPDVDYPYSVAQVIAFVQAGDVDPLVAANELGCDIP